MPALFNFALLLLMSHVAQGHVRLTFPPARTYALDFMDNGRTQGPCGFPRYAGKIIDFLSYGS